MSSPQWRFADFRLDPANACLWRGTQAIALTPIAFDVLHYLVTHPDRLVTKDTLLDAVWPELAISDAVVRIAIGELRRALGDTVQAPRFITTVHRRGYRFVAPVVEHTEPSHAPVAPPADRLAVRLGIHTGLVVVGAVGTGARHKPLALGETPNLAAGLQGLAAPNTLVISATTWQLLGGFFACQSLGPIRLHGRAQPL